MSPKTVYSQGALGDGDTFSYIDGFLNLEREGRYYYMNQIGKKVYAGRMPVYGALFYGLHPTLSYQQIATLMVGLQLLLEALAIALMMLLVRTKFEGKKWTPLFVFLALLASTFHSVWTIKLLPESFCVSIVMIVVYLVHRYRAKSNKRGTLMLISGLLALLIGLKPYLGMIALPLVYLVYVQHRRSLSQLFTHVFILCAGTLLLVLPWTIRNYRLTGEFTPLTEAYSGYHIPPSQIALRDFMSVKGASQEYWNRKAEASFYYRASSDYKLEELYTDGYITDDSLLTIKAYFTGYSPGSFEPSTDQFIAKKLDRMTAHYSGLHPFASITGFASRVRHYLFHSGSYYLPIAQSSPCFQGWHWAFKIAQSGLYYFILLLGGIGLFLWRDWTLWFLPVALIIIFCAVLAYVELRYMLLIYPGLILGLAASLNYLETRFLTTRRD